jgi:molybdate transport system substrate-binding protein
MTIRSLTAVAYFGFMNLFASIAVADAAEIKVISIGGLRPVIGELGLQFERTSGHKLVITLTASPELVKQRIEAGEGFDVAMSSPDVIADLIKHGKIVAATRTDLARTGVGVGVRTGTAKPDVSSVAAFKRTLLNAKSVAYGEGGRSGDHFLRLLDRLGITAEMRLKMRPLTTPQAVSVVAKGEVEIAVLLTSGIVSASGIELAGSLPSELQIYLQYVGGVTADAKEPEAGNALIKFLTSPAAVPVLKANGMELVAP